MGFRTRQKEAISNVVVDRIRRRLRHNALRNHIVLQVRLRCPSARIVVSVADRSPRTGHATAEHPVPGWSWCLSSAGHHSGFS